MKRVALVTLVWMSMNPFVMADNWGHWRGPTGNGIALTGRNGTTVVIKDAIELSILETNSLGEPVDATPAPVGSELFVRGEKHLFCIAKQ